MSEKEKVHPVSTDSLCGAETECSDSEASAAQSSNGMKSKTFVVLLGAIAALVLLVVLVLSLRDKTGIEGIQGEWKVTSAKERGRPVHQNELTEAVFTGDKVVFKSATGLIKECTYRLDDDHQPAWLDIVEPEEHMQGVYALKGNVLRISLNESSDGRATGFNPETSKVVLVLERYSTTPTSVTRESLSGEIEHLSGEIERRPVSPESE